MPELGEVVAQTKRLTPKQRQRGLARLAKPAASEAEIALDAGYSTYTSRVPGQLSVTSQALALRVLNEDVDPAALRKIALKFVADVVSDDDYRAELRIGAAK